MMRIVLRFGLRGFDRQHRWVLNCAHYFSCLVLA